MFSRKARGFRYWQPKPNRVTDGVLLDPVSQSQRQLLAPKKTLTTGHTSWVLIYQELKQKSAY